MGKLIVWGLLIITAMGSLVEASVLKFPTGDYPDLRSAVTAAVVGDTIQQVEPGDFSDGQQIDGRGFSFVGLGPDLCTIHFTDGWGYMMMLGNYPREAEFRGFTVMNNANGGILVFSVDGSVLRISDIVTDSGPTAICLSSPGDGEEIAGDVFMDHVTIKGATCGLIITDGAVHLQNSILLDCFYGVDFSTTWGATLDNHDNLYWWNHYDYQDDATVGPGEFKGDPNLNDANVPIPESEATNHATDGTDLGACQFEWPQSADLHFLVDGQRIAGPPHTFVPGDDVDISVQVVHGVPGYVNLVTYVALSVAGEFYFWPSWQRFVSSDPSTIDSSTVEFHTGDIAEVLHCTLPETGWSASFTVDFYALGAFPGTEFTPATVLATVQCTFGV